jgi:seryl-tRNA synthetase
MIIPEWKRILTGEEAFEDSEVESVAKEILGRIRKTSDVGEMVELYNDLEELMGKGEWLTRKYKRISNMLKDGMIHKDDETSLQNKQTKIKAVRDEFVSKLKTKYGL